MNAMELNRLLEITNDREQCEFCPDPTWCENICTRCNKVKPITAEELREYYREVRKALKEDARLKAELELAKKDMTRLVNENESCLVCNYENCADCEDDITGFVWRGLSEWWGLKE